MRLAGFLLTLLSCSAALGAEVYDIVIYRATASGVMAGIAAAKEGRTVAILEDGTHAGGMVTGGLGRTDMDSQQKLIGGMAREFYQRIGKHYGDSLSWFFEPKVAEQILRDWMADAGVRVFYQHPLRSVTRNGTRIVSIETENGKSFQGKVFIDASYEGDLLKEAGVSYAVGRENRSKFDESLAGRQDILPGGHQLRVAVSAYGEDGKLLPYLVNEEDVGSTGQGDGKIQAFNFRLCLTSDPANRIPIEQPKGYDPARFGLVKNYLKALGENARLGDFLGISRMPNNKTDINAGGGVSTNVPGASWAYTEASRERRKEIWEEHRGWAHGLVYFLGHDPSVPERIRKEAREWGLPKDEFQDTGHWPHQMYVRETRRMMGEHVLTQHDLMTETTKYDSIGMAGYNIDIREVQWIARTVYRFPNIAKEVLMEGYVSMPVKPYEIPYRAILPKHHECTNLLVPVCISSSHVAFASYRMEPQYMLAGQSAGIAAAMAASTGVPVHKLDITKLQTRLKEQGQILTLEQAGDQ